MQVSIIMGTYNCAETLEEAIDSILAQTFESWELIICDDGSSDNTYNIAYCYQNRYPDKIKLIRNLSNMGLNYSLNRCIKIARGVFIARQDGDDISLPYRLEQEVKALGQHPDISVVSTAMSLFDEKGEWGIIRRKLFPQKVDLIYGTPFAHAPCLIRADALHAVGGYDERKKIIRVEDYHLWYKFYRAGYLGMNLQEVLYRCRDNRAALKRRKLRYRINESYVRWLVFSTFKMPLRYFIFVFKPIIIGLLPTFIYNSLHKRRFHE